MIKLMDLKTLRNPVPWQVRDFKWDYIIYYAQNNSNCWNFERTCDNEIIASGSLEEMLSLIPLYPGSRRATLAEDVQRWIPRVFKLEYTYGAK